jgi:hypothetical protein
MDEQGVKTDGQSYSNLGGFVFQFDRSLIETATVYYDSAGAIAELGDISPEYSETR